MLDPREFPAVGRETELAALERFLSTDGPARALVLRGDAGIGKTTLWEAGVEVARAQGFAVVRARASEGEARLSFAGLADLLDGVDPDVLAGLHAPQRQALDVALRRAEPVAAPEPLSIAMGLLSTLRLLADHATLVIAIDDVHWLDSPSVDALSFAARRIGGHSVRFLLSRRTERPSELELAIGPDRVDRLELGPMSFGAISHLLKDRLGRALPRRVVRRVFETSHGNPLFAVELGRVLVERGVPEYGAELPVPVALEDLFGARVSGLSEPIRKALLALALSAGLSVRELVAVVDPLAVEDALASGVLVVEGSRARPAHPLLAAAVSRRSSARERRGMHLELAAAVGDQTLRARHLALATAAPDEALAAEVAAAAELARTRAAIHDAVELATHALRLTAPDDAQYNERLLALAGYLSAAGDQHAVDELLTGRIDSLPAGRLRAAAHLLVRIAADDPLAEHVERAIAESLEDPGLHATALARKAAAWAISGVERISEAEALAEEALQTARSAGAGVEQRVALALAWARILRGHPIDDLRSQFPTEPVGLSLLDAAIERPWGVRLAFRGEVVAARAVFYRLRSLADDRGEAHSLSALHLQLCELALRAGDAREATRLLSEWEQWTLSEAEMPGMDLKRLRLAALHAAVCGVPERAPAAASALSDASDFGLGYTWDRLEAARAAGLAALSQHETLGAITDLQAVWDHTVREQVDDPGAFPVAADLVEALAETADRAGARDVTERLRRLAVEQRHPWGLATAQRCASVLRLADRYDDGAAEELVAAAAAYGELGLGFDRARSLLFLGRVQRRYKKRSGARLSLEAAETAFERLGCDGWAEQARAELARVSGRRPAQEGELTPSERRTCELAASGLSNKEIAAQLFVSVYTVEANLKTAYAKLGISSRTQLAGRLGAS